MTKYAFLLIKTPEVLLKRPKYSWESTASSMPLSKITHLSQAARILCLRFSAMKAHLESVKENERRF